MKTGTFPSWHWKARPFFAATGTRFAGKPIAVNQRALANASLIAAAPDMLEALKNLENDDGKTMPASAWALVQDAIRKAEEKKETE